MLNSTTAETDDYYLKVSISPGSLLCGIHYIYSLRWMVDLIMQAMILAAGFGTRLLPYTHIKPKPLFPLANVPLLLLTVKHLQNAGFDHIIVNCHHLRHQIKELFESHPGVLVEEEHEILGTGGGMSNAQKHMRDEPLLVTNGDIYHNVNLRKVYDNHIQSGNTITLGVHDFPRFNGLEISEDKLLSFAAKGKMDKVAFTGIHVIDPECLSSIPSDQSSCIIEHYTNLLKDGQEINTTRLDDSFWTDMGTVTDYLELHGKILTAEVDQWAELDLQDKPAVVVARNAEIGEGLKVEGWAAIGSATIGSNVQISRSVVWDGARIADNSVIHDQLVV